MTYRRTARTPMHDHYYDHTTALCDPPPSHLPGSSAEHVVTPSGRAIESPVALVLGIGAARPGGSTPTTSALRNARHKSASMPAWCACKCTPARDCHIIASQHMMPCQACKCTAMLRMVSAVDCTLADARASPLVLAV